VFASQFAHGEKCLRAYGDHVAAGVNGSDVAGCSIWSWAADSEALSLSHGVRVRTAVLAHHRAGVVHDFAGLFPQRTFEESFGVAVCHKADVVRIGLVAHAQTTG